MKETRFNILIGLGLIAGVGLVCTVAQAAPLCRTIAAQTVPGGPDICMSLVLTDELGNPKDTFALGGPIFARISMENVGASSIVSTKSFTENKFHLLLLFHDPDGKPITPRHLSSQTPPPPPVQYIAGKPTQMDEVEILQPTWGLRVDPFDVRGFYQLTKSGPYRVKLLIPIITYPMAEVKTSSGKKYAKLDSANWGGELESNPVGFSIGVPGPVILRIRPRPCSSGYAIRIVGENFGTGPGTVHIGSKTFGSDSTRIKLWTDTKIRFRLPRYKCRYFKNREFRRPKVWVTVNGRNSNEKRIKLMRPENCPCKCDLNGDWGCDERDFDILVEDMDRLDCNEPGAEPCEGDIDGNGRVDMEDVKEYEWAYETPECKKLWDEPL